MMRNVPFSFLSTLRHNFTLCTSRRSSRLHIPATSLNSTFGPPEYLDNMDAEDLEKEHRNSMSPTQPFLDIGYNDREPGHHEEESQQHPPYRPGSWARRGLVMHGLMILFYIGLAVSSWTNLPLGECLGRSQSKLFTPVHEHINTEVTVIYDKPSDIKASPYVGEPSPAVDEAWYRLLRHHNIRIMEDELQAMNQTSIPLRHGGGYQGMMAVFHELHCLKLVREAVHADYYYAEKSPAERAMLIGHTEHCIDILRSASMCRTDTAIFPYHWNDATRLPNPTWVQKHECVNWASLEEWLDSRRIDIFAPNMLVHPKYGPAYPGGKRISEPDGPKVYPLDE